MLTFLEIVARLDVAPGRIRNPNLLVRRHTREAARRDSSPASSTALSTRAVLFCLNCSTGVVQRVQSGLCAGLQR
jgi:hypothetical protein